MNGFKEYTFDEIILRLKSTFIVFPPMSRFITIMLQTFSTTPQLMTKKQTDNAIISRHSFQQQQFVNSDFDIRIFQILPNKNF